MENAKNYLNRLVYNFYIGNGFNNKKNSTLKKSKSIDNILNKSSDSYTSTINEYNKLESSMDEEEDFDGIKKDLSLHVKM
tara:strand:+ start:5866 stop:6105 length:240 start_codon:yes stop_codon:yes gene_type:complete